MSTLFWTGISTWFSEFFAGLWKAILALFTGA